jgi:hypothetical protein
MVGHHQNNSDFTTVIVAKREEFFPSFIEERKSKKKHQDKKSCQSLPGPEISDVPLVISPTATGGYSNVHLSDCRIDGNAQHQDIIPRDGITGAAAIGKD